MAGCLLRIRRRVSKPPLPSVLLANVQSLERKIDSVCLVTTVVGLISNNDETAYYREEVRDLAVCCQENNLSLNVSKTKELNVDNRKRRAKRAPINIDGAVVEPVESFKFLGVHITIKLSWSKHIKTVVKRARQHLQETEKIWHRSPDLQKVLQLHHREHPDQLRHRLVWQLLGI